MTSKQVDAATSRELISLLPHRYPFLMVDRILEYEPGKRIVALKNVAHTEYFFQGHFPGRPIMPGVLIIEAIIQAGGIIALHQTPMDGRTAIFTRIEGTRFRRPVLPGDQLVMKVRVVRHRHPLWRFRGEAYVDGDLVCEGEVQAALGNEEL